MHDDGLRHLAEPICAACGGLEYDGGEPRPEEIVVCESCGASATYAEVAADRSDWYQEYTGRKDAEAASVCHEDRHRRTRGRI